MYKNMTFEKINYLIVGISGVTCSGKTTLANKVSENLNDCVVVNQDKYFYPDNSPYHIKVPSIDHNNYDILSSLDMSQMYNDIVHLISKSKEKAQKCVIIVEGFTILNYKSIEELCNLKYQIFLDKEECLKRRNGRVYDPPDTSGYFELCVWPEYCNYANELKYIQDIVYLDGRRSDLFEVVMNDIVTFLNKI